MKILLRLIPAMVIAVTLDWLSKAWAERTLTLYQPVPVVGQTFRLTLGYNTGVAFGLFANGGMLPLLVTGVVIFGLVIWFIRTLYAGQLPLLAAWPIGLLLGGAIANFTDRLLDGHVTDFLDVGWNATRWPTFNLADSFIMLGLALLLLITSFSSPDRVNKIDQVTNLSPGSEDLTP
jgi:signal peptidase II